METNFFFPNPGWELVEKDVTEKMVHMNKNEGFSCLTVNFVLKRRWSTIILNVIFPIIVISLLNNLVFLVPVECGEKVSYAVSVFLAQAVFLSMVSTMTPQVTDTVPALTIYLSVLLTSSVFTVAATIFTVYLHNKLEEWESSKKNVKNIITYWLQTATDPAMDFKTGPFCRCNPDNSDKCDGTGNAQTARINNKYRIISKHINKILFFLVTTSWVIVTVWFFVFTNS